MNENIKVLMIEDDEDDALILKEELSEQMDFFYDTIHIDSLTKSLEYLSSNTVDIIFVDLGLPESQGLETFLKLYKQASNTPIVVVSGNKDVKIAIECVKVGAADYLVKNELKNKILKRVIPYSIERQKIINNYSYKEKIFSIISEKMNDFIAILNTKGDFTYCSQSYERISSNYNSLTGSSFFSIFEKDDKDSLNAAFKQVLSNGTSSSLECKINIQNKEMRFFDIKLSPVFSKSGEVENIVSVSRDITDKKIIMNELTKISNEVAKINQEF